MHFPRNLRSALALLHDLFVAIASLWLAYYLRLGAQLEDFAGDFLPIMTPAFTILAMLIFVASGLYRGLWRYASMQDLLTLTKAVSVLLILFYGVLFFFTRLDMVPRSVPVIHWLVMLAMMGGARFLYRALKDKRLGIDFTLANAPKVPVLLIGANDAAELFIREVNRNPQAPYQVVGLVDDDDRRRGQQLHGIRIYGASCVLEKIIKKLEAKGRKPQRVVLTQSRPSGDYVREILKVCEAQGLGLSRIPQTLELKTDALEADDALEVRPIAVEDLLRRPQQVQDTTGVRELVRGQRVLVTGAGGTIGSELVRQLAGFEPERLVLFEHSEYQLYLIERELTDHYPHVEIVPLLGDVRDEGLVEHVFASYQPQIIFHAAALKHVPLAEANPVETVSTNVLGSACIAKAAQAHKAKAMVLISTDKAVHPSSVMGKTKRMAERLMQFYGQKAQKQGDENTRFMTVRFGNVLGSTGSVVPRFQKQLENGGPITVTHKDMTRYFMTVREAVELVLQAASLGWLRPQDNGGIYVLEMGEPVKIDDLARQMILLAGLSEEEVGIEYTGLRPGEKMHEALFYEQEQPKPTPHESIRLATPFEEEPLNAKQISSIAKACKARNVDGFLG